MYIIQINLHKDPDLDPVGQKLNWRKVREKNYIFPQDYRGLKGNHF